MLLKDMGKNWAIEFVEKPLKIGVWDNLIYKGKDASHSFLRLKCGQTVIGELHGFSFDPNKNLKSDFSFNPFKRLQYAFRRAGKDFKPNTLKVFHFDFHRTLHPELTAQTLLEGSREEVLTQWIKALHRGIEINEGEYEYRPISLFDLLEAQNCHTTTGELSDVIDGAEALSPRHATPGLKTRFVNAANDAISAGLQKGVETMCSLSQALNSATNLLMEVSIPEKIQGGEVPYMTSENTSTTEYAV